MNHLSALVPVRQPPIHKLLLHVDNTTICHMLHKGYSRIYWFNCWLQEIRLRLGNLFCETLVTWVPSIRNLADRPSRMAKASDHPWEIWDTENFLDDDKPRHL
jgi:hypothetical protein